MNISLTLDSLNQFHQKAMEIDQINQFRDDIVTLIKSSSKKGLFKGIINPSEHIQNSRTKKLNSILPKNQFHNRINIFEEFIKHPDVSIGINVPPTLVRIAQSAVPFLIQTLKNGKVATRVYQEGEFFIQNKEDDNSIFCYKAQNKETVLFFDGESAKLMWESSQEPVAMQPFIESLSNPPSLTRIVWKEGSKTKYFSIINKKKIPVRSKSGTKVTLDKKVKQARLRSCVSPFEYSKSILKTTKSVNNPFKLNSNLKFPRFESSPSNSKASLNQSDFSNIKKNLIWSDVEKIIEVDRTKNFLVNSKVPENCISLETKGKFDEIDKMTFNVVNFLNEHVFKDFKISAIVLDFIQDKSRKWILLKCRECSFDSHFDINFHHEKERSSSLPRRKLSSSSSKGSNSFHEEMAEPEILDNRLSFNNREELKCNEAQVQSKKKPKSIPLDEISEKDLSGRYEKINKIANQKTIITPNIIKEPSTPQYYTSNPLLSKFKCPYHKVIIDQIKPQDSVQNYTQQHMNEAVDSFDEIKIKGQISKLRSENLVQKYGGDLFWQEFILSLYNKVLASELLNKYFKNCKLENFTMIVNGMFIIFNGQVSLEFRRKVRAMHQNMGLLEKEFDCYSNIFEDQLNEYQVEENDKQIIMSQIKSMKYLICRQTCI
ncbi:unnamed protein product [Blepharisma stoltei]|uniref:Uncharacterized protein n=1 Tax=Blepharisma stoltei TaxID=1481888 RepID=A0AAU9III7_9CILI|nr:unnamed protein product [Blepharisma stoltei]